MTNFPEECAVNFCKNKFCDHSDGLIFHDFPSHVSRAKEWARAIGRLDLVRRSNFKSQKICSHHFSKPMYHTSDSGVSALTKNAVPDVQIESKVSPQSQSSAKDYRKRSEIAMWNIRSRSRNPDIKTIGTQTLPNRPNKCVAMIKKYKRLIFQLRLQNSRYRRILQKGRNTSLGAPMEVAPRTFLKVTNKNRHPIKMMKLKSFHEFITEGTALLGLELGNDLQLRTEDGCDIDNDDGLLYCVQNNQMVIFEPCDADTSSKTGGPSSATVDNARSKSAASPGWPSVYKLPKLENNMLQQIRSCTTREEADVLKCNRTFTNAFLQAIVKDVVRHTGGEIYLTRMQYQDIGLAIAREYPLLMDWNGSWESLKHKLCRKFKYERSKTSTDKRQEMCERYTPKCKRKSTEPVMEAPPPLKPLPKKVAVTAFEDERTPSFDNLTDFINIVNRWTSLSSFQDGDQLPALSNSDEDIVEDENSDAIPLPQIGDQSLTETNDNSKTLKSNYSRPFSGSSWKLADIINETKSLLKKTFDRRKDEAMNQTAAQEIAVCPPLECSVYLVHEAELVVQKICRMDSPYFSAHLDGLDAWVARLTKHLMCAGVELHQPSDRLKFDMVQFPEHSEAMKMWEGFMAVISQMNESPCDFFEDAKETVRIAGSPFQPRNMVFIDECKIRTDSPIESICVLVAAYLAFNLCHSSNQVTTLEVLEGMLELRKSFSRVAAKDLLKALSIM